MKGLRTITMFYEYPRIWVWDSKNSDCNKEWIEKEKSLSRLIHQDSSFITTFLESILCSQKFFPCSRLNIFCTDTKEAFSEGGVREFQLGDSICHMYIEIDMNYPSFSEDKKTQYLLDTLERAFIKFCNHYSVEYEPVKEALQKTREKLKQQKILGPYKIQGYKRIRQNGITAQLICYHSIRAYLFFVFLSSPVIGKTEVAFFETLPGGLNTIAPLGNFYWKDDNTLCLEDSCKGNPYASPDTISPDKLLDITNYRIAHDSGKSIH